MAQAWLRDDPEIAVTLVARAAAGKGTDEVERVCEPPLVSTPTPRQRLGALLWLVRPAYYLVELVVAAAVVGGYSFVDLTVSDLGSVTCTDVCSPRHPLMNSAFVGFGVLMAFGAVLLHGRFGTDLRARVLTALLVLAGLGSAAVGLVPVDADPGLHVLVATPVFVAQPVAVVLLGLATRDRHPMTGAALVVTGVMMAVAAVGFVTLDLDHGAGAVERVALWPVFVVLALLGRAELRA